VAVEDDGDDDDDDEGVVVGKDPTTLMEMDQDICVVSMIVILYVQNIRVR